MPAKILIVDDHEIVREGIRTLIVRARPDWEICGEARDGEEAVTAAQSLRPDLIVLDITMPKRSGLEAVSDINKLCPGCRILMFTMHESARLIADVQRAGAHGVVLKSQAARDLIKAMERLLSGGTFFSALSTEGQATGSEASKSKPVENPTKNRIKGTPAELRSALRLIKIAGKLLATRLTVFLNVGNNGMVAQ